MRFLLAVMTVGIGGAAYLYLHQSELPKSGEPVAGLRPLFDWEASDRTAGEATEISHTSTDSEPLVVRDTDRKPLVESASALDEFVRTNSEPTPSEPSPATVEIVSELTGAQAGSQEPVTGQSPDQRRIEPQPPVEDIYAADAYWVANNSQHMTENRPTKRNPESSGNAPANIHRPAVSEATLITSQPATGENRTNEVVETAAKKPLPATPLAGEKGLPAKSVPMPKSGTQSKVFDSEWKVRAKSTGGLPMHTRRFGDRGTRSLIVAGIDGHDRIGVRWLDGLADSLSSRSELFPANEILVFRAGNPDGLMRKTPANVHGVLINRNFPSRRYQFLPDRSTGAGPASETETQAILDALYAFRPRRVIHLAATSGKTRVLYNRSAREVADELKQAYQIDVSPLDVERLPGSLEDFADGTLDAAVISMQLSIGSDWQQAWPKHLPAVLTAINGGRVALVGELADASPDANSTRIPVSIMETPDARKTHRGYEELPPPPK